MPTPPLTPGASASVADRPGLRLLSWTILLINALFLVWIIAGLTNAAPSTAGQSPNSGVGVPVTVLIWALVNVILGIGWLVSRRRHPHRVSRQQPGQAFPPPSGPDAVG